MSNLRFSVPVGCAAAIFCGLASTVASATAVQLIGGTYPMAETCPNYLDVPPQPCDGVDGSSMTITIAGSLANVSITDPLDPSENASFTMPDYSVPAGFEPGASPYFSVYTNDVTNVSWNESSYPYITFWSALDGGGIGIGDDPSDDGNTLTSLFESNETENDFVVPVPEPAGWGLVLSNFALVGFAMRRRHRGTLGAACTP
jgi:hypothetical protein